MKKIIENIRLSATYIFLFAVCFFSGFLGQKTFAQNGGDCNCAANEVIFELVNPANLSAVAAQYSLNPTPLGQAGAPATYRMQIANGQTPAQIVAAMQTDARITKLLRLFSARRRELFLIFNHKFRHDRRVV